LPAIFHKVYIFTAKWWNPRMLRRLLAWLQAPPVYLAAAAFVALVMTAFAILFGYLSPDSWFYIMIAQGLRQGHGCAMHGDYLGVYPCGYPAALALTAPAADYATLMVSSKFTNLMLLAGSFWLTWKASRNVLVATVVTLNPVTLFIALHTWSENLELFCICGVFYALARLNDDPHWRNQVLLGLFLAAGCFTRYFFGPFAFLLFVAAWLTYGRGHGLRAWAIRVLPPFAAAGLAYLGYQGFNLLMTGYPTGMPRAPAPETLYYLTRTFLDVARYDSWNLLVALAILLVLAWPSTRFSREKAEPARHAAAMLILYAGLAFTGLAFVLRVRTFFDPFDTRTIGFGLVFIAAGLVGRFVRLKDEVKWPSWAALAAGLFSAFYADDSSIPDTLPNLTNGQWAFAAGHLPDLLDHGPKYQVMVTFDLPPLPSRFWNVERVRQVYYGDTTLISTALAPDITPDTPKTLLAKLDIVGNQTCAFDFTAFPTLDDFKAYLNSTTPVDETFTLFGTPKVTAKPIWDPSLQRYLLAIVQPGKRVPCADILNLPVTRAALVGQTETPAEAAKAAKIFLNH
jgi:hypothetical protein